MPPPRRSSRVAEAKAKTDSSSQEVPSSDIIADSDAASDMQDEAPIVVETQPSSSPQGRRKSDIGSSDSVEDESLKARRAILEERVSNPRNLPVRIKDASSPLPGILDIEIPIPAKPLASGPPEPAGDNQPEPEAEAEAEGEVDEEPKGLITPAFKKSGHIRFDNDGDGDAAEVFYTPLEAPARNPLESSIPPPVQEDGEEDSDDDAAPEAVSTSAAAARTLKSAQAAAKIAEQQAASQKRKRQDRDALFKAQASQRRKARVSEPDSQEVKIPSGRQRTEKTQLPALLPAELLESDDGGVGEEDGAEQLGDRLAKKVRLDAAARADRGPADRLVGSTLFKVMKESADVGLAPKASKRSQDMRQQLLARRRIGKKMGGGFLVKGRS